jgi:hypothetical protein
MKPLKPHRISNKLLPFLPIEADIPIPPVFTPARIRPPHARWGLERLRVGESVYMIGAKRHPKKLFHTLKKNHGLLFTARIYSNDDGSVRGVRVWRVV